MTSNNSFELHQGDEAWPDALDGLGDVSKLYGVGDLSILTQPSLAVIGARRATPYGLSVSEMLGRVAAECGIPLLSGGAMGCDCAALTSALSAGGQIIIVSGCGADMIYPHSSEAIFRKATSGAGVVVSLEHWGAPPRRYAFPKRNRVIAALCQVLVVAEAGIPSGTFSTASAAADLGKELYAIPGPIFSPSSRGTNQLIEQGASIISDEMALEVKLSLDFGVTRLATRDELPDRGRVLSALVACPTRPDELATRLGIDVLTIVKTLSDYEMHDLVKRLPDGRYSPTNKVYLPEHIQKASMVRRESDG